MLFLVGLEVCARGRSATGDDAERSACFACVRRFVCAKLSFVWSVGLAPFHLFLHSCCGDFLSDDNPDTALITWAAHSVWTRNSCQSRFDVKALLFVGDMIDL